MDGASSFNGLSGETVRAFVKLRTLFTVIPALVVTIVLAAAGFLIADLAKIPDAFGLVLSMITISPVLGAYGLAARYGDLESGVMNIFTNLADITSFAARYSVLTIIWGLPASFLALYLMKSGAGFNLMMGGGASSVLGSLGLIALILILALMPVFTLIISIAAESVGDVVSTDPWAWLLGERRGDLPAFFASYFGGMALFFIITIPFLLLITAMLFVIDLRAGIIAAGVAYVIPFAAAPVLLGRLAGSFVAAEDTSSSSNIAVGAAHGAPELKDEFAVAKALEAIKSKSETDLITALREAEELRGAHPENAVVHAELCRLYVKKGESENAIIAGQKAISRALATGANDVATQAFKTLGDIRKKLKLEAKEYEKLARTFTPRNMFDEAVWCFRASAAVGGDKTKVQKGIISVAEAATRAGNVKKAMAVYAFFIKSFPDSEFIGYCKNEYKKLSGKA